MRPINNAAYATVCSTGPQTEAKTLLQEDVDTRDRTLLALGRWSEMPILLQPGTVRRCLLAVNFPVPTAGVFLP